MTQDFESPETNPNGETSAVGADISALATKAAGYKQSGEFQKAESVYRSILEVAPNHAESHYRLGHVLIALENLPQATESMQNAIRCQPDYLEALMTLGALRRAAGEFEEAEKCFREAVRLRPGHAEAHYLLGIGLKTQEKPEMAAASFREAIRLKPEYAPAHFNLADVLREVDKTDEAVEHYYASLRIDPDDIQCRLNLGAGLYEQEEEKKAFEVFQEVVRLKPDFPDAYFGLGVVFQDQHRVAEAEENFRLAIHHKPDYTLARIRLAGLFQETGRFEEAKLVYEEILRYHPENSLAKLSLDIFCPGIFGSTLELNSRREEIKNALDTYEPSSLGLDKKNVNYFPFPPLEMVHHGQDEKPWRSKYADLFREFFQAEYPEFMDNFSRKNSPPRRQGRPHIGIVVTRQHEGAFLLWMKGIVEHLSKDKFDVSLVCYRRSKARLSKNITRNGELEYFFINTNFREAVKSIRARNFDLLLYHEVGTDSINYFLPFFRLAPVQCVTMGHGYTTGISEMDYFISSDLTEPSDGEMHYRERLIRLKTGVAYFSRPEIPPRFKDRSHFGFSNSDHIYSCPQNMFKFHPDFDEVLGHILRRDPKGILVILEGAYPGWNERLMERFHRTIPGVADRIHMLPRMSKEDFISLVATSDVMLDPIHVGVGTTMYEGLATGTPLVTWPGQFARARITYANYRKMGVMDCVASSPEEYVEIALKLGNDRSFRESVKKKILESNHVIYDDMAYVREMEDFFLEAIEEARSQSS